MIQEKCEELIEMAAKLDSEGRFKEADNITDEMIRMAGPMRNLLKGVGDLVGDKAGKALQYTKNKLLPEGENWFRKQDLSKTFNTPAFTQEFKNFTNILRNDSNKLLSWLQDNGDPTSFSKFRKVVNRQNALKTEMQAAWKAQSNPMNPLFQEFLKKGGQAYTAQPRELRKRYVLWLQNQSRRLDDYQIDLKNEIIHNHSDLLKNQLVKDNPALNQYKTDGLGVAMKGGAAYMLGNSALSNLGKGNKNQPTAPSTTSNDLTMGEDFNPNSKLFDTNV